MNDTPQGSPVLYYRKVKNSMKDCNNCWYKQYCDEEDNPDHKCYICEEIAQTVLTELSEEE